MNDFKQTSGSLYIVSTPIGNLEDITLRALRILKEVELIAAEDTRRTKKLLHFYKIDTPLTSYYEYNKIKKGDFIIKKIKEGGNVALVSDAGTPGISDPGYHLIQLALNENLPIIAIPGVSAVITALSIAGLPTNSFIFEGFPPRKKNKRKEFFRRLKDETKTIIFYESPYRIKNTLQEMLEIFGNRKIVLARELTKKFEQIIRGEIAQILEQLGEKKLKGEFTIVVGGNTSK